MTSDRRQLGLILLGHSVISDEQLQRALEYQTEKGCGLGDALLELDFCSEVDVARALAEQNDIPFVDLSTTPPTPQALRLISREVAVEYGVVPVRVEGPRLLIAARNPYDFRLDDVLKKAASMPVLMASAAESQIKDVLNRYDELKFAPTSRAGIPPPAPARPRGGLGSGAPRIPVGAGPGAIGASAPGARITAAAAQLPPEVLASVEHPATVGRVNAIIAQAVRKRASELHFEPDPEGLRVRSRIDGRLHPLTLVPRDQSVGVFARLKILSGIDLSQVETSPCGTCRIRVDGRCIELRNTLICTEDGEILIFRIVDADPTMRSLEDLGIPDRILSELQQFLVRPSGLLLVSGPDGCGKQTTLYAMMNRIRGPEARILTLETTFERKLTGLNQVQVGDRTVHSFTAAMNLCLTQKPDALLVGELPDRDAAELACRGASTGERIFAGSWAPDALSAVSGLVNQGVSAGNVAAALTGVLSQRLVRRVCAECTQEYRLPFHLEKALRATLGVPEGARFAKGDGCARCNGIGSRGRVGVFELLVVDEDFRALVSQRAMPSALREYAEQHGYRSLEEDALAKACRGLIEPEEIARLGMSVGLAMDEMGASVEPAVKAGEEEEFDPDKWEGSGDPFADAPELGDWGAVADLATALN